MADKPTEKVVEIIEVSKPLYLALAFVAGALLVTGIVYWIGSRHTEDTYNAE